MTYENLVISGGGHTLFQFFGVIEKCLRDKIIEKSKIKRFYCTSAGGLIAVLFSLDVEWKIVYDYFIERPWDQVQVFNINLLESLYHIYHEKGFFKKEFFKTILEPFFKMFDISEDITLNEFYELTKKEINLYTFEVNSFTTKTLNYKLTPDIKLLDALHMTSALPVLFSPYFLDGKCYIDGGVKCNYPIEYCLNENDESSVIGLRKRSHKHKEKKENNESNENNNISSDVSFFEYIIYFVNKILDEITKNPIPVSYNIKEILCYSETFNFTNFSEVLKSKDLRQKLFDEGLSFVK